MLSRELEETLRRAMSAATAKAHEFATLEHLLLALTEDSDALEVLSACKVDIEELRLRLTHYIETELASIVSHSDNLDVQPTASFQRVIQRAIIHTQSSGREVATTQMPSRASMWSVASISPLIVGASSMPSTTRTSWRK